MVLDLRCIQVGIVTVYFGGDHAGSVEVRHLALVRDEVFRWVGAAGPFQDHRLADLHGNFFELDGLPGALGLGGLVAGFLRRLGVIGFGVTRLGFAAGALGLLRLGFEEREAGALVAAVEIGLQFLGVAVLVGDDPASEVYVRNKGEQTKESGMASFEHKLPVTTTQAEMLALIEGGLEDVSASRSRLKWGIPFPKPLSSGEVQTTYVWFDALPNYLTATGFPEGDWAARWPAGGKSNGLAPSAGADSASTSSPTSTSSSR